MLRAHEATGQPAEAKLRPFRAPESIRVASTLGVPGEEVRGALNVGACEIANWLLRF